MRGEGSGWGEGVSFCYETRLSNKNPSQLIKQPVIESRSDADIIAKLWIYRYRLFLMGQDKPSTTSVFCLLALLRVPVFLCVRKHTKPNSKSFLDTLPERCQHLKTHFALALLSSHLVEFWSI